MSKIVRVIYGATLVAAGVIIGVTTQNWTLAFTVASFGAGLIMQPSIPKVPGGLATATGSILQNRTGAAWNLPVIYGTITIAGAFVDIRVDDASTARKRLVLVSAWCHGSRDGSGINGIDQVWFDSRKAVDGVTLQAPFNSSIGAEDLLHHYLEFTHYLGSSVQTIDPRLLALFPTQWPTTAQGRGVCYSRFELWYNTNIYPGGIPNIQVKMRGNNVYDVRDGTWKFSSNPALCIRDYILSSIYGLGIAEANLDNQSFIDMANHCDELVSLPGGGTQVRYDLNGWVDTSKSVEQNLAEMCSSCRGQVLNEADKWRLIIRRARQVSGYQITELNTIEGSWQFILPGAELSPNIVRVSYTDPLQDYTVDQVQWPEAGQVNQFLIDDNNYEQRLELDLPFTNNRLRVQQLGMVMMKESRSSIGVICTLKEEALSLRVGDLVEVTYPTPGWVKKIFDVGAMLLAPDGSIRAVLMEYQPTVYSLDTQFVQPSIPSTNLPSGMSTAAPTGLILNSVGQELAQADGHFIPRILATWTKANDPFVDYYEIQAKLTSETNWDAWGRVNGLDLPQFFVYPVTANVSWDVQIRAINKLGVASVWLGATIIPVVQSKKPQILSITLTNAHSDIGHIDLHTDIAHGDAGHTDAHTDSVHTDHTDHSDSHNDAHTDSGHTDSHTDFHADHTDGTHTDIGHYDTPHADHTDGHGDSHTDGHNDSDHSDTGHVDFHSDHTDGSHSDVGHYDVAHTDHTDTALSHTDIAHVDSHTDIAHADLAHSDGHTDQTHSDGPFGVGIALQADVDSASLKAVARKVSVNKILNGDGETGTVGAQATSWTQVGGNGLLVANDFYKRGGKSLKTINTVAADSFSYATGDVAVVAGKRYRVEGWVKTSALPIADAGLGAFINVNIQSGVTSFTIIEKLTIGADPASAEPDCGIAADGIIHDWTYVFCRFIPLASGVIRLFLELGYGAQSGTAWWDDVGIFEDEPSALDVRSQQPVDGRNVVISLVDMATANQIQLNPGDMVRVGALAYSGAGGTGAEGPLALASVALFTIAPVGTDQWVPG